MPILRTVSGLLIGLAVAGPTCAAASPLTDDSPPARPIAETLDEIPWQDLFSIRLVSPSYLDFGQELPFRVQAYSPYDLQPRQGV